MKKRCPQLPRKIWHDRKAWWQQEQAILDARAKSNWGRVRQEKDVAEWFQGTDILDPGLVEVSTWRPDDEDAPRQLTHEWIEFGGVGRIR